jgi:hypothetical protein
MATRPWTRSNPDRPGYPVAAWAGNAFTMACDLALRRVLEEHGSTMVSGDCVQIDRKDDVPPTF